MNSVAAEPLIDISENTLGLLNKIFANLSIEERIAYLYRVCNADDVLVTSSFGTRSVTLLHYISRIQPSQVIHFIDTTYHFLETIAYREHLSSTLKLKVVNILPEKNQNALTREESWWIEHPKMCCTINKIAPLEPVIAKHKIWISSLMAFQTSFRSHLRIFEKQGRIIKFHPLIDISESAFENYLEKHDLPRHPLEEAGYGSVGCTNCTIKAEGRDGRWLQSGQSECGLHPHYFINK